MSNLLTKRNFKFRQYKLFNFRFSFLLKNEIFGFNSKMNKKYLRNNFFNKSLNLQNFDYYLYQKHKFFFLYIYNNTIFRKFQSKKNNLYLNLLKRSILKQLITFIKKDKGSNFLSKKILFRVLRFFLLIRKLRLKVRKFYLWNYRNQYKYFLFRFFKRFKLYLKWFSKFHVKNFLKLFNIIKKVKNSKFRGYEFEVKKNKLNLFYDRRQVIFKTLVFFRFFKRFKKLKFKNLKFLRKFEIRSITIRKLYRKLLRYKKLSAFGKQIRIYQKFRYFFGGLPRNQIKKMYYNALRTKINYIDEFLSLLESRVDVFLFRLNIFNSILQAKQYILHKGILINNKPIFFYNFHLSNYDIFSFFPEERNKIFKFFLNKIMSTFSNNQYFLFKKNLIKLRTLKKIKKKRKNLEKFKLYKIKIKKKLYSRFFFIFFKVRLYKSFKFLLKLFNNDWFQTINVKYKIKFFLLYFNILKCLKILKYNKKNLNNFNFVSRQSKILYDRKLKELEKSKKDLQFKFLVLKKVFKFKTPKKLPIYIDFNYSIMSGCFLKNYVKSTFVRYVKRKELLRVCNFIRTV